MGERPGDSRRRIVRRLAAGLLIAVAALLAMAASASAEVDPNFYEELTPLQQKAVTNFFYEQSPQGTVPYTEEAVIEESEALSEAYDSEPEASSFLNPLEGDVNETTVRTGLLPELPDVVPKLGAVGAAFSAGYLIGEGVNAVIGRAGLLFGSAPEEKFLGTEGYEFCYSTECSGGLEWHPYGYDIYYGGTVQQKPGAYLYSGTAYRYGSRYEYFGQVRWWEPPCDWSDFSPPPYAHLGLDSETEAECYSGGELHPIEMVYPYITEKQLLSVQRLHHFNPLTEPEPEWRAEAPEDPGTAVVEEYAAESIDESGFLQAYLGWKFFEESEPQDDPAKIGIPPKVRSKEDQCTPVGTSGTYDPGPEPGGYEGTNPEAYPVNTFASVENPFSSTPETVHLFWGNQNWGYRHIQMSHGWSEEDRTATTEALLAPDAITPDKYSSTSKDYYSIISGTTAKLNANGSSSYSGAPKRIPDFPAKKKNSPMALSLLWVSRSKTAIQKSVKEPEKC